SRPAQRPTPKVPPTNRGSTTRQLVRPTPLGTDPNTLLSLSLVLHDRESPSFGWGKESVMATVQPCTVCGAPIVSTVTGPFAGAAVVSPLCPACTEQLFLDQGGAV